MAKTSMKKRAVVIGIILGLAVTGRKIFSILWQSDDRPALGPGAGVTTPGTPQNAGGTADSLLMGGSAASDDAANLAGASAYSAEDAPYDADISREGVTLSYVDPTDREGDVPLDEGIPNLGEPVDVEDTGQETLAEEHLVDQVESDVPEEYGEDQPIDSVEQDDAWVADSAHDEDDIPAASRGFREYGEGDEDEEEIEDTDDTESFELDEETEPSGSGGEVDLENDEAPQGETDQFEIVDGPNETLSADAGGTMVEPLAPEETLGLRDSESTNAPGEERSNLGMTGDYDEAAATQRIRASSGEADTSGDAGEERRTSFATGDRDHEGAVDTGADRITEDQEFGGTSEFGVPVDEQAGPPIDTSESHRDIDSASPADAGNAGPDTGEAPEGDEHLGVSGEFDAAEDTAKMHAEPADGDEASESADRDSYVTGHTDDAGYSAAWSTPAGVMGEFPDQEDGAKGFPGEHAADVSGNRQDTEDVAASTRDENGGTSAGESGQITSEAKDRAGAETASDDQAARADTSATDQDSGGLSGGDAADLAAAAAGDLGVATDVPASGEGQQPSENPKSGGVEDAASSNATANASQKAPRKSRKQRRLESLDWVPAGAVKGDGTANCPVDYPIKGNANSRIYHRPEDPSYASTIPEYCFTTEDDAKHAGFRAPKKG